MLIRKQCYLQTPLWRRELHERAQTTATADAQWTQKLACCAERKTAFECCGSGESFMTELDYRYSRHAEGRKVGTLSRNKPAHRMLLQRRELHYGARATAAAHMQRAEKRACWAEKANPSSAAAAVRAL